MDTIPKRYNRCSGFTKSGKRCRAKIDEDKFYCCKDHEPYNMEIHTDGCFMCSDNITTSKELIQFKCRHVVHRCCYNEWIKFANYNKPSCVLCRTELGSNNYNNNDFNDDDNYKYKNKKKVIINNNYCYPSEILKVIYYK